MTVLECVPNISEGRRVDVIEELQAAAGSIVDARLLHSTSDPDHNRTVLTLAGEPRALEEAVLAVFSVAAARIDLRRHRGVHPRIGAVDVVPFVPLGGLPMVEAVAAARGLGRRLAERFDLPVLFYENAATRPEHQNLASLRRGGLDDLARRLARPDGAPDHGPSLPDPRLGATAVGARGILIAFNAVLATGDVAVARAVAAEIRESNGGLPALKAIGVRLASRNRAQVSMNLVDYRRTAPIEAVRAVATEAERLGTTIESTELIGLIPSAALEGTTVEELRLEGFRPEQVLERALEIAGLAPAEDEIPRIRSE